MRVLAVALISFFAPFFAPFFARGQEMNVSLCNLGELPEPVIARAKSETESVFQSAGIRIYWRGCDEGPAGPLQSPWFTLRLRAGKPPVTAGPTSLDAMGRAFLAANGSGSLADAYVESIRSLAERHEADADALLGCVIAHELGHLLLGPGHVPDGVMRAAWNGNELKALRQRWLKFNETERILLRQRLEVRSSLR